MGIRDRLVGAGFAGAGALMLLATLNFPPMEGGHPGPALFPRLLAGLLIVCGGMMALRRPRGLEPASSAWAGARRQGLANALCAVGGVLTYLWVVDTLGFVVTATLLTWGLMWRLGVGVVRSLLVAGPFVAGVYSLFAKLLRVPLPTGLVWW